MWRANQSRGHDRSARARAHTRRAGSRRGRARASAARGELGQGVGRRQARRAARVGEPDGAASPQSQARAGCAAGAAPVVVELPRPCARALSRSISAARSSSASRDSLASARARPRPRSPPSSLRLNSSSAGNGTNAGGAQSGRPALPCGHADDCRAGGTSTRRPRSPRLGAVADRDRADQLRASADRDVGADRRSLQDARSQADRHKRRDRRAGTHLRQPVDHHLAMNDVHPGATITGSPIATCPQVIASRCARSGAKRHTVRLQRRLAPVESLRQVAVRDGRKPDDLSAVSSRPWNSWRSPRNSAVTRASSATQGPGNRARRGRWRARGWRARCATSFQGDPHGILYAWRHAPAPDCG